MVNKKETIIAKALEILEGKGVGGIRYAELKQLLQNAFPDEADGNIRSAIYNLRKAEEVKKPGRGIYVLAKFWKESTKQDDSVEKPEEDKKEKTREEEFYKPFADYLESEDECTKAIALGGSTFKNKGRTPDVIGVYRYIVGMIKPSLPEIVSAEIKIDTRDLVTGFGQACSYKLFSHKVYLVIPKDCDTREIEELELLCSKIGIGLVLFDRNCDPSQDDARFETKIKAIKDEPDYFYVNSYLERLDESVVKKLF